MRNSRIDPYLSDMYRNNGFTREQVAAMCQRTAANNFKIHASGRVGKDKTRYIDLASHYYQQARLIMGIE